MPQPLGGPGLGLPYPTNLYPSELYNSPLDCPTNIVTLSAGQAVNVPAGVWYLYPGQYSDVQFKDPVTSLWKTIYTPNGVPHYMKSDGFNLRMINQLGCPVAAAPTAVGSGYVQSTTTITPSAGSSTWQPIVGGSLGLQSINNAGSGFGLPPLVFIPAPPSPGIPASASATLTGSTVSGVTLINNGAGYTSATVSALLLPAPNDPNYNTATTGSVSFTLTNSGALTGALCTNQGTPLASVGSFSLTVAGAGTGASLSAAVLQTIAGTSVVSGGAGWGTASALPNVSTSGGGFTATSANKNPWVELTNFAPREANGAGTTNAGGTISAVTFYDTGKFLSAPSPVISAPGTIPTSLASLTFTMGYANDTVVMQPAP